MFQKVTFLEISRSPLLTRVTDLDYTVYNASKNELLTKYLNGALKLTENFQEVISNGAIYQKFTDLQTAAFRVFKTPGITSPVEFLSSEAGANGFSIE